MSRPVLIALLVAMALVPDARADIAGGRETDRAWPWMAKVWHGRAEAEQDQVGTLCGATLLTSTWAITAAHCIEAPEIAAPHVLYLSIGRHTWNDPSQGEAIKAKRVLLSPGWDVTAPFRGDISGDDAALIELEQAAVTDGVKIAGPGEEALWAPGVRATILGWGTMQDGNSSNDLMEAAIPIISDAECATKHPREFEADTMLCASDREQGIGTCSGDSGGPLLVVTPSGAHRQAGVTSWGSNDCGKPGKTSAFARVAGPALRDWIGAIVPEAIGRAQPPPPPPVEAPPAPAPQTASPPQPQPARTQPKKTSRRSSQRARRRKACLRRARTRAARKRCARRYYRLA